MATRRRPGGDAGADYEGTDMVPPTQTAPGVPPAQGGTAPPAGGTGPTVDGSMIDASDYRYDAQGRAVYHGKDDPNKYYTGNGTGGWIDWEGDPAANYRLNPLEYKPTDNKDYLGALLEHGGQRGNGGMGGQDAASYFDQLFGRKSGNEAVYYGPEAHGGTETIGLPEGYFANESGKWNWHDRVPEGPSSSHSSSQAVSGPTHATTSLNETQAPAQASFDDLMGQLKKLFPDGAFNHDIVNRRTEGAAENLRRFGKSQRDNDRAALAERGLLGSGPEQTAQDRLEQGIADQYSNAVSGIYADESRNADNRMMSSLQTAAGLTEAQSRNIIDSFMAQSGNDLGWGQLGLGRDRMGLDRELGLGNLDLNRVLGYGNLAMGNQRLSLDAQQLQWAMEHGDNQQILELIQQLYGGANTSAGGHR